MKTKTTEPNLQTLLFSVVLARDTKVFGAPDVELFIGSIDGEFRFANWKAKLPVAVSAIRGKGRKRILLWARSAQAANEHNVCRVVWAGPPKGPGFGAHKLGWVPIDKLEETVRFHVEMLR